MIMTTVGLLALRKAVEDYVEFEDILAWIRRTPDPKDNKVRVVIPRPVKTCALIQEDGDMQFADIKCLELYRAYYLSGKYYWGLSNLEDR